MRKRSTGTPSSFYHQTATPHLLLHKGLRRCQPSGGRTIAVVARAKTYEMADVGLVVRAIASPCQTRQLVEKRRQARALHSVSAEPRVDSFSDGNPPGLEHHVVTHVGEEFCFGAICACRCAYFFPGMRAVIVGP